MADPQLVGPTPAATMTKGEFAAHCNVAPSRVSHWLRDGRISGDALVGTGRAARIVVEKAQAQLRSNLSPYQRLPGTNGAGTRLDPPPPPDLGEPLSPDAHKLMWLLSDLPHTVAWETAVRGETTQRAFDVSTNLRRYILSMLRHSGFSVDESDFEPVDWPGLAEELGAVLIDPDAMAADWQHRADHEWD